MGHVKAAETLVEAPPQRESDEASELNVLEAVIERGLATFVEVGLALHRISEGRLYRALGYASFADYAEERWAISRSYAYRKIEAARVVAVLEPVEGTPLPVNEAQARELARLRRDPDTVRAVWQEAVAASGGRVTAGGLRQRIDSRIRHSKVPSVRGPAGAARGSGVPLKFSCPRCGFRGPLAPDAPRAQGKSSHD